MNDIAVLTDKHSKPHVIKMRIPTISNNTVAEEPEVQNHNTDFQPYQPITD